MTSAYALQRPTSAATAVIAFALAAVLAAVAMVIMARSGTPIGSVGEPSGDLPTVARLEARRPLIGALAEFDVNGENPFVPFHLRWSPPAAAISDRALEAGPTVEASPTSPIPLPALSPLLLPAVAPPADEAPLCIGLINSAAGARLFVHLPAAPNARSPTGAATHQTLMIGDTVAGWRLIGIEDGVARFLHSTGSEHRFAIGASTTRW